MASLGCASREFSACVCFFLHCDVECVLHSCYTNLSVVNVVRWNFHAKVEDNLRFPCTLVMLSDGQCFVSMSPEVWPCALCQVFGGPPYRSAVHTLARGGGLGPRWVLAAGSWGVGLIGSFDPHAYSNGLGMETL